MKEKAGALRVSPLMGMERRFFEAHKESLCAHYAVHVQRLVDEQIDGYPERVVA